jgi:hypothetical protein
MRLVPALLNRSAELQVHMESHHCGVGFAAAGLLQSGSAGLWHDGLCLLEGT